MSSPTSRRLVTSLTAAAAALAGVALAAVASGGATPPTQTTSSSQTTSSTQTTTTTDTSTTTETTSPSQTQGGATVAIDDCRVKRSRQAGGFTWFYCGVVSDNPGNRTVTVRYRVNLTTFKPSTGGTWRSHSGTVRFSGGESLLTLKFAVRNRTVAQVRRSVRVTLSGAQGATISDATATAR
jgi:hypothetical protein